MSPYFSILATLLQNIAAIARNPAINPNAQEGSTVSRVGELIDVAAGLVRQGASAITELEKFNAQVLEIKTSGRALEQADFDRLKALSDSYQRRRDALKAQGVDLDAEDSFGGTNDATPARLREKIAAGVAPSVSRTVDSPSGNSDQNDRLARRPMNPTVPGAREVIARQQGGVTAAVPAASKPAAAAAKPASAASPAPAATPAARPAGSPALSGDAAALEAAAAAQGAPAAAEVVGTEGNRSST